jgi:REP element-mobilizing transposase RayT
MGHGFVRAYHLILTFYGFWLPNDPRGSSSDFVRAWELLPFGKTTRVTTRRSLARDPHDRDLRRRAKEELARPPVVLNGIQARAVARGFQVFVEKTELIVYGCSILPEHVHLVIARRQYSIEQVANLLKGSATTQLRHEGLHPFVDDPYRDGTLPTPWTRKCWSCFLGDDESILRAIRYVQGNPMKQRLPEQHWSFIKLFRA